MLTVSVGHATHAEADVLSVAGLNVIAGHSVVAFAPEGQNAPWGQAVQLARANAPASALKDPAGQGSAEVAFGQ